MDLDNFNSALKLLEVNALEVKYLLDEQEAFSGKCRVSVKHEEKQKSLEALKNMKFNGQEVKVIQGIPEAKIYISNLDETVPDDYIFKNFKKFG